jgi:hypothetical protein
MEIVTIPRLLLTQPGAHFRFMKSKPETKVTPQILRESGLKVAQVGRMAEADVKVARAAKQQLKSARKTWKLARKAAKRSAKRFRKVEKEFRLLEKQLRRSRPKLKAKTKSGVRQKFARHKTAANSKARSKSAARAVPPISNAASPTASVDTN